ncbi:transposase [Paenibacillus mucilaginosus]|nr:transposase [Paenibacillus caseinilyticus]MCZ8521860.1 transposase [Paenibacillus caseinilyticus]
MKWPQRLASEVQACRYWTRYVDEEWVIEGLTLIYKATSWKKARRVAIIRKAQRFEDGQSRIVLDTVTNLEWEPLDLWRFYNQRCCMENFIKEA